MIFSGGEMVFHRLEIRSKATNDAEIESKILEKVSRHPRSSAWGEHLCSPPLRELPRLGVVKPFLNFLVKECKNVRCA